MPSLRSPRGLAAALFCTTALAPSLAAQSCPLTPLADHQFQHVWGGDIRAVHTALVGGNRRILAGGDGGRMTRTVDDGLSWQYATTPLTYSHTLLDIEFLDDATGFACGRGGQVLRTTDGGATWSDFGTPVTSVCGEPATVWAVYPFTPTVVLVAGLTVFSYTVDGGATWLPLQILGEGATYNGAPLPVADFHFYEFAIAGTLGNFRGAASAEWKLPNGTSRGVVVHTDSADPLSSAGRRWRITLDDVTYAGPVIPGGDAMVEPWGLAFERGAAPQNAIGYVFGGIGANGGGRGYRTANGGASWIMDWAGAPTPYRVTAEPDDRVMVAAYSGVYLTRNGPTSWTARTLPGPAGGTLTPGLSTAALGAIDSSDGDHFVVGGGFGSSQKTADYGATWSEANPVHSMDVEEQRLGGLFASRANPDEAWAVGQLGGILHTDDGGCTWAHQHHDTSITSLTAVAFRDGLDGVAVGSNGTFLYTHDGGGTWLPGQVLVGSAVGVNLTDVAMHGSAEAWAIGRGGNAPRIYYSRTRGEHWFEVTAPPLASLRPQGIVWPSATRGLLVGWSTGAGGKAVARAYVGSFDPVTGAVVWLEVSPPEPVINPNTGHPSGPSLPLQQKLLAIDAGDGDLGSAAIYAVGNGGMVLRWDGVLNAFVDVPAVYDTDAQGNVLSRALDTDLSAVGVAPGGQHVVIGAQYDIGAFKTGLGKALRFDGSWSVVRALTGKNAVAVSVSHDGLGWVAGQAGNGTGTGAQLPGCAGYDSNDQQTTSFDLANLADSVILRYVAQ
ncbi:MAG: WD40/YVTN/BNR-like repeat-containing protein [Planctomycetota bacterium]